MSDRTLPVGTRLDDFRITAVLGRGGFGITYKAFDERLRRDVAIKEYFPRDFAVRDDTATVRPRELQDQEVFAWGLTRFIDEARALALFNHPNIVAVTRYLEANGTAYLVMKYEEGNDLERWVSGRSVAVPESILVDAILRPLLDGLAKVHEKGLLHRDIKPANVFIRRDGSPVLIDFGSSRSHRKGHNTTLTSLISGGYSPFEQYGSGAQKQGPWSDLYALAGTAYRVVTGSAPTDAIARHQGDEQPKAVRMGAGRYSERLLSAIDQALALDPNERPQSASEFAEMLPDKVASPSGEQRATHVRRPAAMPTRVSTVPYDRYAAPRIDKHGWRNSVRWLTGAGIALVCGAAIVVWWWADRHPLTPSATARFELLVSTQDTATYPAVARDGSLLTYVGGQGNRRDLFVRTLRGSRPIRITDDDAREATPRLSPDGTEIVFARLDAEGRLPAVFRIATLGGKPRLVVEAARSPVWSPDGRALAYVSIRPDHAQSINIIDLRDAGERTLFEVTAPYVSITSLDWGRHDKYVAVLSTGGISGDLWVIDANGTPRLLIDDPPNVFSHDAVFSGDGRAVVYSSNRAGAVNLWRQPLGGESTEQLTRGPGPDEMPAVAATGQIVFQSSRSQNALVVADMSGAARTLVTHHASIWAPAFSPDGNLIAYSQAETDGSWHIWVTKRDGSETRQVTDGDKPEIYPRFVADSREVLYFTWALPHGRVWRVNVDGGSPRPVTPTNWDASYADAGRTQRIVLTRVVDGEPRLALLDLGVPQAEPRDLGPGTLPRWSPDDEWIAFTLDRSMLGGIYLVRPDGTARRQLTAFGGWPTWFPDGRVGFTAYGSNANQQNFVVSVDDDTPRPIPGPAYEGNNFPFDVAPDGLSVVTSNSSHISDEIWLLSP